MELFLQQFRWYLISYLIIMGKVACPVLMHFQ
nr:MAG TPA: hypothetical protein [Caudoviricetes sp.]